MFFYALLLVAISDTAISESDTFLRAIDDYVAIILAVVALAVLFGWWKRQSLSDLRRGSNIVTVLAVLVLLATIFAITQEIGDPKDFGNEIPSVIFSIFLLINRFI